MDQVRLKALLEKYRQGSCNAEELALIEDWYENLGLNRKLNKEKAASFLRQLENAGPDFEEHMYEGFLSKLQQQQDRPAENIEDHQFTKYSKRNKRLMAAASIILLLGLGWWGIRFIANSGSHQIQTARLADTIQPVSITGSPGQNRAILTLAGGQTILLDTLKNGLIATTGGFKLMNKAGTLNFSMPEAGAQNTSGPTASAPAGQNTLRTAAGEQYKLILPDGTKVWLNAASTLEFPASFAQAKTRSVKLEGEAYFEVVHNSRQPFMVQTAHQTIEDLGTAFNVTAYKDDPFTKTTLLEGAVQVSNAAGRHRAPTTLVPGQQASLANADHGEGNIRVARVETESVVAWKNGYFRFDGEDIYAIMRRVSRWYKVQVVYDEPVSKNSMEGSMSRFENVSKILNIIEKTGLFKFKMEGSTIHVSAQ
ncbi:FecR family protein [Arachidicoccus terrestris]|uniref:FecR family protein n=1 Tax=Arachidicoccus terrestris TaxID=2875539 RepID=UPI001CC78AB0|nr:FecR family protein [Arachidicoccus terrestris]UAY55502.1 FecR domain-containing protein [Arachidicoccus terrestris]